jgi:hypothetical protein
MDKIINYERERRECEEEYQQKLERKLRETALSVSDGVPILGFFLYVKKARKAYFKDPDFEDSKLIRQVVKNEILLSAYNAFLGSTIVYDGIKALFPNYLS